MLRVYYNPVPQLHRLAVWNRGLAVKKAPSAAARAPPPVKPPPTANAKKIAAGARRVGAVGIKVGMLRMFDEWGRATPITVVKLEENIIVSKVEVPPTSKDVDGHTALVVGYGLVKQKHLGRSDMGLFVKHGVDPRRHLKEFPVSKDALLEPGTRITANHFVPGQLVDVSGTTIGKGFQGAMKRWGFSGQPRTHGASRSHRSLGGTGARQDPGKTWKGKKMHGHMGNVRRTQQSVVVFGLDPVQDLLFLKGSIPGHAGGVLEVKDAIKYPKQFEKRSLDPPFPVATPTTTTATATTKGSTDISVKDWVLVKQTGTDPLRYVG